MDLVYGLRFPQVGGRLGRNIPTGATADVGPYGSGPGAVRWELRSQQSHDGGLLEKGRDPAEGSGQWGRVGRWGGSRGQRCQEGGQEAEGGRSPERSL